jgi:hypothetical protein
MLWHLDGTAQKALSGPGGLRYWAPRAPLTNCELSPLLLLLLLLPSQLQWLPGSYLCVGLAAKRAARPTAQLQNAHWELGCCTVQMRYLDHMEAKPDVSMEEVMTVYERCLVPCASYPGELCYNIFGLLLLRKTH